MLSTEHVEGTSVVAITIDGGFSTEEAKAAKSQLSEVAAANDGKANVLVDYQRLDAGTVEPKAAWEDLKGAGLLEHVDRAAIVADQGLVSGLGKALNSLTSMTVKSFDAGKRDDAIAWLTNG